MIYRRPRNYRPAQLFQLKLDSKFAVQKMCLNNHHIESFLWKLKTN